MAETKPTYSKDELIGMMRDCKDVHELQFLMSTVSPDRDLYTTEERTSIYKTLKDLRVRFIFGIWEN